MNNYSEMPSDELGKELNHLQASFTTRKTTAEHTPLPTEEELQTILDDLQTTQPVSILQISSFIAMQRLLQELQIQQVKLERQSRELCEAEEAKRESEALSQSVLGSLTAQIAVLDKDARIIAVNESWTRFTLENGGNNYLDKTGVGVNYLDVCRCVEGEDEEVARAVVRGIQSVLDGSQTHFSIEYSCHSSTRQRWFTLSVSPLVKSAGGVVVLHSDITERKQAEAAVLESEVRSAGILNSAMDAIITTDASHRIVQFNAAAEEMFCCPAQEAIGESLSTFIPKRYRNMHPRQIDTFGKTKTTKRRMGENGIIFGLRADGEEFPMESSISQVEIGGQKFFTVIHRDLTQRLQRTEALRKSEALLAATQAMVHLGSFEFNLEPPEEVFWSDETFKILGLAPTQPAQTREDFLQRLVHPEDRERVQTMLAKTIAETASFNCEYRVLKPDGTITAVVSVAKPVLDETGKIVRLVGTIMDITERKYAEHRLIEQAAMLNQAQEAILLCDIDGEIRYWNRGAERVFGCTEEEVIGRSVKELLTRNDSSQLDEAMQIVLEKGDWSGEINQFTKDGKKLMIEARWTLIRDERGKPESILAINNDITEKKKLEAQFLRAQRLESIGTLASGIAHDLNNVLSPVLMAVQLLQMRMPDESCQRILDVLQQNILRGSEMVKQILSFARGSGGERIAINPKHLLKEAISILHETLPKNIIVKYSVSPDLNSISGDPTQVHQVLMNLCVNARDAMQPSGGTLTIEADNKFVDEQFAGMIPDAKAGQYIVISITDTGTGIAPEVLEKIFDPFFTTKEVGRGTGLGLSTVHSIIKGHSGFVNVYSEVGKGTKFHLYLPVVESKQALQPVSQSADFPVGHGELILVVDDEKAIREITQGTLESFGYRVLTATDGAEAIALYAKHKDGIQLVLTDMMMPYLDGPTMIRALHKINPVVGIIASSGLTESDKAREAAELGVKTFLTKPYTAQELLKALHKALGTMA